MATTLLAVLAACLAPWLRWVPEQYVAFYFSRSAFFAVGVLLSFAVSRWHYQWARGQAFERGRYVIVRCDNFGLSRVGWVMVPMFLIFALILDSNTYSRAAEKGVAALHYWSWWSSACVYWVLAGGYLRWMLDPLLSGQVEGVLTNLWLLLPHSTYTWPYAAYARNFTVKWRDREVGRLLIEQRFSYRLELSVNPDDVEQVESLLQVEMARSAR